MSPPERLTREADIAPGTATGRRGARPLDASHSVRHQRRAKRRACSQEGKTKDFKRRNDLAAVPPITGTPPLGVPRKRANSSSTSPRRLAAFLHDSRGTRRPCYSRSDLAGDRRRQSPHSTDYTDWKTLAPSTPGVTSHSNAGSGWPTLTHCPRLALGAASAAVIQVSMHNGLAKKGPAASNDTSEGLASANRVPHSSAGPRVFRGRRGAENGR